MEAPSGFANLDEPRPVLADLYFGGKKVGDVELTVRPGKVRFDDPEQAISLLPGILDPQQLLAELARELPANAALICSPMKTDECGRLSPAVAGIIFDEERFRIDLFVNPGLLAPTSLVPQDYLEAPSKAPSMVSSVGLTLSGSGGRTNYNIQNRTLLAAGNARVRSDSSYARGYGLVVDNLVAEVDARNLRYSAGMFWAPGIDLVGQRRIVGAGVATQFDTRTDKDLLEGTPLYLFLDRATRVDILVDGRLLDSRAYEAGNNLIDTTALPTGAYALVLRIHDTGGRTREERRFFARNAQVAPQGKPMLFAYAGMLANTRRHRPVSPSGTFYYQAGGAYRLSAGFAVDAAVVGTQRRSMVQLGGYHLGRTVRMRAAALLSTRGDTGALIQASSTGSGPLSLNVDLRRISSKDNRPLIPVPAYADGFSDGVLDRTRLGSGTYTQASGSIGYRIGQGYVGVTGAYRHDRGRRSDYSVGPSITLPVVQRSGLQLAFQADAQRSRSSTAAYVGFRLNAFAHGRSLIGNAGYASRRQDGERAQRMVGTIAGELYHQAADRSEWNATAAAERTVEDTNVRAGGSLYSRFGVSKGDVLHRFGDTAGTQYGVNIQAGLALSGTGAAFGGRELMQSALIASVAGDAKDAEFDLLINNMPKGRLRAGQQLPVYLPAYRRYDVRLRPVSGANASFDTQERSVTLFPGTVAALRWSVEEMVTVFGKVVDQSGAPIADARVETRHGIGESDSAGFFQVDLAKGDELLFTRSGGERCRVTPSNLQPKAGYAALGKVMCR